MRRLLLAMFVACSGCKTAEIAVNYPATGIHVVAKFEARDPARRVRETRAGTGRGDAPPGDAASDRIATAKGPGGIVK